MKLTSSTLALLCTLALPLYVHAEANDQATKTGLPMDFSKFSNPPAEYKNNRVVVPNTPEIAERRRIRITPVERVEPDVSAPAAANKPVTP